MPFDYHIEPTKEELALPDNFWDAPESFIQSDGAQELYRVISQKLCEENPSRDISATLLIERASALYAHMRDMERTTGYQNSSDYRQFVQLWNSIVTDLRKQNMVNVDEDVIRQEIVTEISSAIAEAVRGLTPEIANTVKQVIRVALG